MMKFLQLCMFSLLLPIISLGMTPHEFVKGLNEKRKILAENHQLGNVRELSWKKDLAVAVVDSWSNKTLRSKENIDLVNIVSFEQVLRSLDESVGKDRENLIEYSASYVPPLLAPLHDKIGCSEVPEVNENPTYCYLSPISPVKEMFDNFGAPGTRCSPGYEGVNGLCRFVKSAPTTEKVAVTTVQPSTTASDIVNQETAATTTAPEPTTERVTVDIAQQITKTSDIDHQKTSDSDITTPQTSADDALSSGSTHSFLDIFLFFMFISFLLY
ncbi:unnamed protein product [Caenorhabditis brenneri]